MPAILFDLDGVILKNSNVHQHVANRCTRFVSNTVGIKSYNKAALLNKSLYQKYGHTLIGLNHLGYDVSLGKFNSYVYAGIDYPKYFSMTEMKKQFPLYDLSVFAYESNVNCYIYSNAPLEYVEKVKFYFEIDWITIPLKHVSLLKPQEKSISYVKSILSEYGEQVMFLDDNSINIQVAQSHTKWQCIKVDERFDLSYYMNDILSFVNVKDKKCQMMTT